MSFNPPSQAEVGAAANAIYNSGMPWLSRDFVTVLAAVIDHGARLERLERRPAPDVNELYGVEAHDLIDDAINRLAAHALGKGGDGYRLDRQLARQALRELLHRWEKRRS